MSGPISDVNKSDKPFDRLTKVCAEMSEVLSREENTDIKAVIFLHDAEKGGIETVGYEDELRAVADVLIHLKAIFEANGKQFGVMTDQGILI